MIIFAIEIYSSGRKTKPQEMDFCVQNCTNCTTTTTNNQIPSSQLEIIILVLMLIYTVVLNITGIMVTIGSAELRGCLFSMQLAASYVGDILGACSLIGKNEIQ